MGRHKKRRVPKLSFTKVRGIGWHVNYRDPVSNVPRRARFGDIDPAEASKLYAAWLTEHLAGRTPSLSKHSKPLEATKEIANATVEKGSLLHVASGYLFFEERRVRKTGEGRRAGTISSTVLAERKYDTQEFLKFINSQYGQGAVRWFSVLDLKMSDIEKYNAKLVDAEYSDAAVSKRMHVVKALIDRAGRPEYGEQRLAWNWDSRDILKGRAATPRSLPTLLQVRAVLDRCDARTRAMVWMAIGLGFGQGDLSAVRVGQIDADSYDLRRGKTGLDRYGETPPGVWQFVTEYLRETPRDPGELLFVTKGGKPLTHGNTDAVHLWWRKVRIAMKELGKGLGGFYVLRHLGATEYGSRPTCSIGNMRRWLGHSASSSIADVYMRPVSPEHRDVVEYVRNVLLSDG